MRWFNPRDAVACANRLFSRKANERTFNRTEHLNFIFIGDSRLRQIFLNFLKFIPHYDLEIEPRLNSLYKLHQDVSVTSRLLNLRLSFFWRPFLENCTKDIIPQKIQHTADVVFFILGMAVHHMIRENHSSLEEYLHRLKELLPLLNRMTVNSQVIWLKQYPVIELFGQNESHNTDIHSAKIHQYNLVSEELLRKIGVTIWNSGNIFVEEYIRSCFLLQRDEYNISVDGFFSCLDYIHPGTAALYSAMQLILNEICYKT
ncbi:N-acetylneuraminate 9-O-acetyltransferase-like [Daphnia carinata]|uniref:N-acetylneuraminate 9-O-acetyltransferase-like n=1 Tax=Daphnia carinata TaxID=120202 RepID=UPI00286946D8|nr:N-acetylneuraminate 9-O-acetyltransferase-like [Daphnia carinata]